MSKKKREEEILNYEALLEKTKIKRVQVVDEMSKSFISYAMAVNVSRAIPDVMDGLKPVHRRILYDMGSELGLYNDKPTRKCARIVGDVMGKFHPHGDSAIYDALARLAQDFNIRYPLVEGQGNFGSIDGDPPAAPRYTEARLSKIAKEMLRDINKDTVDFYPNFDNSMMQPRVLPARFPAILVNGADGIAVGMATNIPPHNLREVIGATLALIDNPDIECEELMEHIPAPDYPTGGIIMGRAAIRQAYRTGHGGVIIRAKTEIEEGDGQKSRIIVTEIPYQVNKSRLVEQIANLIKDKRIEGISSINDESGKEGLRITIDIKRDASPQVVLNLLYKHSNLQVKNGITLLALVNGEPKILGIKEILTHYVAHQRDVIQRRTKFDLLRAEERCHIVEGLVIALNNIDEVIALIKKSKDRQEAIANLMEVFAFSDKQAKAILEMRFQRLTNLEIETLKAELASLKEIITDLADILAKPHRVDEIVKKEMQEICDIYGDDRRTEISQDYGEIDLADLIAEEDIVVTMTHGGYIKRISTTEYRAQRRGGKGVVAHKPKEEDFVENMFVSSTHQDLLCFSSKGKVYVIKGYDIPEASRTARGRAIVNILPIEMDEKINAIIPIADYESGYLMMITKLGSVKRTKISEFEKIRKVGKIATTLIDGDELMVVLKTTGEDSVLIGSKSGKCIRIDENDVRSMGRQAKGVKSMNLKPGDTIVDMIILSKEGKVLTITENGYGKRTEIDDYRIQGRSGKGVKASVINEKTGLIAGLKLVTDDDDIIVISTDGTMIRVSATDISTYSRDTLGVKIMNVTDSQITSIAVVKKEEEEEEIETSETSQTAENPTGVENETSEPTENQEGAESEITTTETSADET